MRTAALRAAPGPGPGHSRCVCHSKGPGAREGAPPRRVTRATHPPTPRRPRSRLVKETHHPNSPYLLRVSTSGRCCRPQAPGSCGKQFATTERFPGECTGTFPRQEIKMSNQVKTYISRINVRIWVREPRLMGACGCCSNESQFLFGEHFGLPRRSGRRPFFRPDCLTSGAAAGPDLKGAIGAAVFQALRVPAIKYCKILASIYF